MSELLEHEVSDEVEEPSFDDQVVEAFDALRDEETDEPEAVASTDTPDEDEAPEPHVEQEPSSQASEPDQDLEYARKIVEVFHKNPELRDAVVAVERGEAAVIPREVLEAAQKYAQQPQAQDEDEDIYADPFAVIKSLKQDIEQFKSHQQAQVQARRRQEWENNTAIVETVEQEFFRNHPELNDHRLTLFDTIAKTQLIRRYREKFNGDNRRAVAEALEAAYRMEFPEAAVTAAQRKLARETQAKRRAGAAAASPRSMPRNQPEERPTSKADRLEMFADIIREDLQAQT